MCLQFTVFPHTPSSHPYHILPSSRTCAHHTHTHHTHYMPIPHTTLISHMCTHVHTYTPLTTYHHTTHFPPPPGQTILDQAREQLVSAGVDSKSGLHDPDVMEPPPLTPSSISKGNQLLPLDDLLEVNGKSNSCCCCCCPLAISPSLLSINKSMAPLHVATLTVQRELPKYDSI